MLREIYKCKKNKIWSYVFEKTENLLNQWLSKCGPQTRMGTHGLTSGTSNYFYHAIINWKKYA
jgi:hypothetical protein